MTGKWGGQNLAKNSVTYFMEGHMYENFEMNILNFNHFLESTIKSETVDTGINKRIEYKVISRPYNTLQS